MGFHIGAVEPVWPHPYAVVSFRQLHIGLHEYRFPSPSFTTVHAGIEALAEEYLSVGMHLAFTKTGADCFNEFGFRDPGGNMITVLERATHLAAHEAAAHESERQPSAPLGEFFAYALPAAELEISLRFWQLLGAEEPAERIGPLHRMHAGGLPIVLHERSAFDRPRLLFRLPGAASRKTYESPEGMLLVQLEDH
jgi:hypothetical protein